MENKHKHLEFIQNVITRMNTNSFMIKGWNITLISALFALASKDSNEKFVLITYLITPFFWLLDGYFLSMERQFRALYNEKRLTDEKEIDFDMNIKPFNSGERTWICTLFSKTILFFYLVLIIISIIVMFFIK